MSPPPIFRQVLETNLMGCVYGSREALRHFRGQGRGTLINISSINALAATPYASAYVASKHAVRGMTDSIRMELETEGLAATIKVCTVMPAATDTNFFQNAANYMHRTVQAMEPVYEPELVARRIVKLIDHPKREVIIGGAGLFMAAHRLLLPGSYDAMLGRLTNNSNFGRQAADDGTGSIYRSIDANSGIHGGWSERRLTGKNVNIALGVTAAVVVGLISTSFASRFRHK